MTTMKTSLNKLIVALVGIAAIGSPLAQAQTASVIYDNSTTSAGSYVAPPAGSSEYGNQISFAGTGRIITDFKFQYFMSGGTGSQTWDLRLYANDGGTIGIGASQKPGTLLYDSTAVPALNSNSSLVDVSGINVNTFSTATWTVSFGGITSSQKVGLLQYGPPTVGSAFNDMWVNLGTQASPNWTLENLGAGGTATFAAQVTAVPEPTVVQFGIVAGLAGLSMLGLRRRSTK